MREDSAKRGAKTLLLPHGRTDHRFSDLSMGVNDQFVGADGPGDAAGGGGGAVVDAGAGVSRIDRPGAADVPRSSSANVNERAMNITASTAVVRVSKLAVPRPDMKEPIPCELPMPRPPPSLRCIKTTPIRARVTNKWIISRTVLNARDFQ